MAIQVYRLENRDSKLGPYEAIWHVLDKAEEMLYEDEDGFPIYPEGRDGFPSFYTDEQFDAHPGPRRDGLVPFPPGWIFGFKSEAAMREWFFRDEMDADRLDYWGLTVVLFEVDEEHVRHGSKQLVFDREQATEISIHRPTDFKGEK